MDRNFRSGNISFDSGTRTPTYASVGSADIANRIEKAIGSYATSRDVKIPAESIKAHKFLTKYTTDGLYDLQILYSTE